MKNALALSLLSSVLLVAASSANAGSDCPDSRAVVERARAILRGAQDSGYVKGAQAMLELIELGARDGGNHPMRCTDGEFEAMEGFAQFGSRVGRSRSLRVEYKVKREGGTYVAVEVISDLAQGEIEAFGRRDVQINASLATHLGADAHASVSVRTPKMGHYEDGAYRGVERVYLFRAAEGGNEQLDWSEMTGRTQHWGLPR